MKEKIVTMRFFCSQNVSDNPIIGSQKKNFSFVDDRVFGTSDHGMKVVKSRLGFKGHDLGYRFGPADFKSRSPQAIGCLIFAIDQDRIVRRCSTEGRPPIRLAGFIIGISAWVNDQRTAVGRNFHI